MSGAQMTTQLPDGLDTLLGRRQTADALTSAGFPISPATLQTMATRGGGPLFRNFGMRVIYRWGDALEWAQNRLSKPRRSSSELNAQHANAA
jgi:hypothetical protein